MSTWVIGGTSGIGEATAKMLRGIGHDVVATGIERDVTSYSDINGWIESIECDSGPLQSVVYCAGVTDLAPLGGMGLHGMRAASRVLDVNLLGFIGVIDALARGDRRDTHPLRIVAVTSDAAERPMRTSMAYCASKAGLNMAVRVAARELGPLGWRINGVAPGMTQGTMMQNYIDRRVPEVRGWTTAEAAEYEDRQAIVPGRIHVDEVAQVICDTLLGPDHMNGSITTINGGR